MDIFKEVAEKHTDDERLESLWASSVAWFTIALDNESYFDEEELFRRMTSGDYRVSTFSRRISESIGTKYGIYVPTIYPSRKNQMLEYRPGDYTVLLTCLDDLKIVDEEKVTWEQVNEFRQDAEAKKLYRRLINWLDKEMVGKSATFIEDEMSFRLDKYSWAIKKHGIKTVTGALWSIVDNKTLLSGVVTGSSISLSIDPFAGIIAAAGVLATKCALQISESVIDLIEAKRGPGSEVSYVYEAKKYFRAK